jgi:hypothetical protein
MKYGRDDWIRTSDPLTPSQVRYQTAPHPDAKQLAERGTGGDPAAWGAVVVLRPFLGRLGLGAGRPRARCSLSLLLRCDRRRR